MAKDIVKSVSRVSRARRVRSRVTSATGRPRLSVFRSNKNIFAQIIDDRTGTTLAASSTLDKGHGRKEGAGFTKEAARDVGKRLAEKAKEKNIEKVVFDRGPYLYHGKVKALAEGAREGGLSF